jgi:hypothetical protein
MLRRFTGAGTPTLPRYQWYGWAIADNFLDVAARWYVLLNSAVTGGATMRQLAKQTAWKARRGCGRRRGDRMIGRREFTLLGGAAAAWNCGTIFVVGSPPRRRRSGCVSAWPLRDSRLVLAKLFALPEGSWAVITAIIVMQASVGGSVAAHMLGHLADLLGAWLDVLAGSGDRACIARWQDDIRAGMAWLEIAAGEARQERWTYITGQELWDSTWGCSAMSDGDDFLAACKRYQQNRILQGGPPIDHERIEGGGGLIGRWLRMTDAVIVWDLEIRSAAADCRDTDVTVVCGVDNLNARRILDIRRPGRAGGALLRENDAPYQGRPRREVRPELSEFGLWQQNGLTHVGPPISKRAWSQNGGNNTRRPARV